MYISWKWLSELIVLPNISPHILIDQLVLAGLEVENIIEEEADNFRLDIKTPANRLDVLSIIGLVREIAAILRVPFRQTGLQPICQIDYDYITSTNDIYQDVIFSQISNLQVHHTPKWLIDKLYDLGLKTDGTYTDVFSFIKAKWGIDIGLISYNSDNIPTSLKNILDNQSNYVFEDKQSHVLYVLIEKLDKLDSLTYRSDLLNAYAETRFLIQYIYQANCGSTTYCTNPIKNYAPIIVPKQLILQTLGDQLCKVQDRVIILSPAICKILHALRFRVLDNEYSLTVNVPQYRQSDIVRSIDVIEEIGRMYGFDQFIAKIPRNSSYSFLNQNHVSVKKVRAALSILGLYEVVHYSLTSNLDLKTLVHLYNPLSEEYSVLRQTLIHSLLNASSHNINQGNDFIESYEIGKVFYKSSSYLPSETPVLAGLLGGGLLGRHDWSTKPTELKWLQAKGDLLKMFEKLRLNITWHTASNMTINKMNLSYKNYFNVGRTALLYINSDLIGIFGQVSLKCSKYFKVPLNTYIFELNLLAMTFNSFKYNYHIHRYSRYPAITRDISIKIDIATSFQDIIHLINTCNLALIESIQLFDLFLLTSDTQAVCKNVGLRIKYRSYDSTLTRAEVDKLEMYLLKVLNAKLLINNA